MVLCIVSSLEIYRPTTVIFHCAANNNNNNNACAIICLDAPSIFYYVYIRKLLKLKYKSAKHAQYAVNSNSIQE